MFYIYKIRNILNNKIYIGKTYNVNSRWNSHVSLAKRNSKYLIHRAIRKNGKDNFEVFILEEFELEAKALEREMFWIAYYKTNIYKYGPDFGYNLTDGGEGVSGRKHTQAYKDRLSMLTGENSTSSKLNNALVKDIKMLLLDKNIKLKTIAKMFNIGLRTVNDIKYNKRWTNVVLTPEDIEIAEQRALNSPPRVSPFLGVPRTDDVKQKVSEALSGKPKSEAHKKQLSLAKIGIKLSEEHKANIGKAVLGRKHTPITKERCSISKTGEKNPQAILNEQKVREIKGLFIENLLSNKEISNKYGVAPRTIRDIKNNKTWRHIK